MNQVTGIRELILGGARSGKSTLAERRALEGADDWPSVVYLATGEALDAEMASRIEHHRQRRPAGWKLVEEPLHLATALRAHAAPDRCLLVDCLTLWLSNLLHRGKGAAQVEAGKPFSCSLYETETADLLKTLPSLPGRVILVSNEVGSGIVPLGALSRLFADTQGRLNQQVAAICERVTLVVAGLPLEIKRDDCKPGLPG